MKYHHIAAGFASILLQGCAGAGGGDFAMGLPKPEFDRVFVAAIDVAGTERCGGKVDGALVRSNLIAFQTKRALPPQHIQNSGSTFDTAYTQFKQRIAGQADYCTKDWKPELANISAYEKGDFPDVR